MTKLHKNKFILLQKSATKCYKFTPFFGGYVEMADSKNKQKLEISLEISTAFA
jgi:hypothetical protein